MNSKACAYEWESKGYGLTNDARLSKKIAMALAEAYREGWRDCGGATVQKTERACLEARLATINDILWSLPGGDLLGRMSFEAQKKEIAEKLAEMEKAGSL